MDQYGKQKFFWGSKSSKVTKEMAESLETEHRQVRLGYRPAPSPAAKHQTDLFNKVKDEYLAWGEAQGGRGGRPWGALMRAIGARTWHGGQSASDCKPWWI
jgi:hypothetical protein